MRRISVADYFVEFLIANGVEEVFGYQGGMIAYIFDSLGKYKDKINYHSCGNEQGAALAACSYAQASGKLGVAISTSGPGFTNMATGIANAWFDSIPVLFVSGNVNTKDKRRDSLFRQNGFQEIQAAKIAAPMTKASIEVELNTNYVECFDSAIKVAMTDRKGPVYIDLPINICREMVDFEKIEPFCVTKCEPIDVSLYFEEMAKYERPIIIAGAGIKQAGCIDEFRKMVELLKVPVVTTMPGIDLLPSNCKYMLGYIGGTARREAGIALQNADFVLSIGTRLCSKQIGHNMDLFAPKAKRFYRVDIDLSEFERQLKPFEEDINCSLSSFINGSIEYLKSIDEIDCFNNWSDCCAKVYDVLAETDMTIGNQFFRDITKELPKNANIILDVGKNMTYGAQSAIVKENTKLFMSAGLGTMGYAIPAAIGAYLGNKKPTFVFTGDGGAQMNIQELNTIVKLNIPAKIIVLNNRALGNIRIFQESYLNSHFVATSENEGDYYSCDFSKIARAYGIKSVKIDKNDSISNYYNLFADEVPVLFEIIYDDCAALPGIVAGGEYLSEDNGLTKEVICEINGLLCR